MAPNHLAAALLSKDRGYGPNTAAALVDAGFSAKPRSCDFQNRDLGALSGEHAVRIACRSAAWASAVIAVTRDHDAQQAILTKKACKTVVAAAAENPNLGPDAALIALDWALSNNAHVVANKLVTDSVPLATVLDVTAEGGALDGYNPHLAAGRFDENIDDAITHRSPQIAAAALAAARCDGSAVDSDYWRKVTIGGLDRRDDIDDVFMDVVQAFIDQPMRIDVTITRSAHLDAFINALSRITKTHIRNFTFDDDALADIWEHATAGDTKRLARLVGALPLNPKMFDEAVSHDDADVVCAIEKHLINRDATIGNPLEGSDRYAAIIAERWTRNNPGAVRKLLSYPLSDTGMLNVLRCGDGSITGDWIVGAFDANPANIAVYEKLEADPGHGAGTTVPTGTGRVTITQPVDAHLITRQSAWRRRENTGTYNADVIARVPQMLHTRNDVRDIALDFLAQRINDRFGDDPEAWTLAVTFGEDHHGSIDELIELVAATHT